MNATQRSINGPARCWPSPHLDTINDPRPPEWMVHFLVDGIPVCKLKTNEKFTSMDAQLAEYRDYKKCETCFKGAKEAR